MPAHLVAVFLAAARVQVAAPDLQVVELDPNRGALFAEHLGQQLTLLGLDVVSSRQIGALIGQERQKSLLGCGSSDSSCMAELASALGSEAVITGSVAKLGSSIRLNITVVSGADAKPLSVLTGAASSEDAALELITAEAPRVAKELVEKLRPGSTLQLPRAGVRRLAWVPGVVGLASGVIGVGLLLSAYADSDNLRGEGLGGGRPLTLEEGRRIAEGGAAKQTAAVALITVGFLGLAAAAAMMVLGGDTPAQLIVGAGPGGAALLFTGRWP